MTRKVVENKDKFEPATESPETIKLKRFFPQGKGRFDGMIVSGFFGPDSPDVREEGRMSSSWIMGGLFCVFTWDEWTFSGKRKVNPVHGYAIVGWDSRDREYRMLRAANLGVIHQLNGTVRGGRLAFVSDPTLVKGKPTRIRYTFIRRRAKAIDWVSAWSVSGGPWKTISESHLRYE